MSKIFAVLVVALFLTGCCFKQQQPPATDAPLRLTTEEVIEAPDGNRIVVYFPLGVEEPVVIQSNETGGWVAAGKVPPQ